MLIQFLALQTINFLAVFAAAVHNIHTGRGFNRPEKISIIGIQKSVDSSCHRPDRRSQLPSLPAAPRKPKALYSSQD